MRHSGCYWFPESKGDYQKWYNSYSSYIAKNKNKINKKLKEFEYQPLISVILLLDEREEFWDNSIRSIQEQLYNNWQLCIACREELIDKLRGYVPLSSKIKILPYGKNDKKGSIVDIVLQMVEGEYTLFLQEGDRLSSISFFLYLQALNQKEKYGVIYGDEDRVNEKEEHFDPFFKPRFSPELLTSVDYISRGALFKTECIRAVGGFNKDLIHSFVFDLIWKIFIAEEKIYHIPHILYHVLSLSQESARKALDSIVESCQVLETHLKGKVLPIKVDKERIFHRVFYEIKEPFPKISIIIPTKDKVDLLRTCISSIQAKTSYPNYEIIVVDNQSTELETLNYLSSLKETLKNIKILTYDKKYNYSAINNYAVEAAEGSIICCLNNDTEVINANWLQEMLAILLKPGVGAVGAKLYYPTGYIQHAGVHGLFNPFLSEDNNIFHGYAHEVGDYKGYLHALYSVQNLGSVTAACVLIKKSLFLEVDGFDEENAPIQYSDIDLCFKLREKGYRIAWTPYAELYHYESASTSRKTNVTSNLKTRKYMATKWKEYFSNDIYVNPNLSFYYKRYPVLHKFQILQKIIKVNIFKIIFYAVCAR